MAGIHDIWVYLSSSPLLHLTMTLVAYQVATFIYARGGHNPLLNPVLIAILLVVSVLVATGTTYDQYFAGAQFVHFLLGPATVALAIPLYRQFDKVRNSALAVLASVICGSLTAAISALAIGYLLGATQATLISMAPKSVTTPVAMEISRSLGGLPSLTAAFVLVTGITGAMLGPPLLNLLGIRDWAARGLAVGTASHGLGTARAMEANEIAGAFSGLAMGLNALATAILLPLLWHLLT